jgi:acetoin:2,6-dichlorophenolindophenol oxidoreductase subunit alpha
MSPAKAKAPAKGVKIPADQLELALSLYETMVRIRLFEERVGALFAGGDLPGFVHLSIGQESVAAGVCGALRESDYITATHRGHGHILAKGASFEPMLAELMGRSTGYCRGKGGSMHIADLSLGVLGANGILGAGQPIAVGAASSARAQGRDDVAVTFFGEGASAQGAVSEAMNLAALWRAPVLFVAEINGYAELTPYDIHVSVPSIAQRGEAFGMPARTVDARDVLDVFAAAQEMLESVRGGGGPALLELRTVRHRGHFEGDQQRYRDPGELERLGDDDPIALLEARLLAAGADEERLRGCRDGAAEQLAAAVQAAQAAPMPAPEDSLDDIYATTVPTREVVVI